MFLLLHFLLCIQKLKYKVKVKREKHKKWQLQTCLLQLFNYSFAFFFSLLLIFRWVLYILSCYYHFFFTSPFIFIIITWFCSDSFFYFCLTFVCSDVATGIVRGKSPERRTSCSQAIKLSLLRREEIDTEYYYKTVLLINGARKLRHSKVRFLYCPFEMHVDNSSINRERNISA